MFPILKCEMTHLTSFIIISAKTVETVFGKHCLNERVKEVMNTMSSYFPHLEAPILKGF